MDTIWETDVSVSRQGGVEERACTLSIPRRVLNFQITTCSSGEVFRLLRILKRSGEDILKVPLVQDQSEMTQASVVSATSVRTPTQYFRFYPTKQILIATADGNSYEEATIASFNNDEIFLTAPLSQAFPLGSRVFPLMEADYQFNQQPAGVLTDSVVQNQLTFREVTTIEALPPFAPSNDLSGRQIYDGLPVLETRTNYANSFRFQSPWEGDQFFSGQGRVSTLRAPIPRFSWSAPHVFCTRQGWSDFLNFFSSRRGRLLPFYTILPVSIWKIQQVAPGFIDVDPLIDSSGLGMFTNLGLVGPDGTSFITAITSIAQNGPSWRLSITDDPPAGWTSSTIRIASAGVKARFARDSFREIWDTSELPRATMEILTLIDERDFASTIPGSGTGLPGGSNILFGRNEVPQSGGGSNILSAFVEPIQREGGSNVLAGRNEATQYPGGSSVLTDVTP